MVRTNVKPLGHWPAPLAFVLSGGGAYGATQAGMIRALIEAKIVPDLIVGASVGALNGVQLAADPSAASDALAQIWHSIDRKIVFGSNGKTGAVRDVLKAGLLRSNPAVCSPARLRLLIEQHTTKDRLEQLSIETVVVVTDLLAGKPKLLRHGSISDALLATAAIPGVFPPVQIDGCIYVDGGVSANVPIRQAIEAGARSVVVLDANPAAMPSRVPSSPIEAALHSSMIMQRNQLASDTAALIGRYPILHLPQVTPPTLHSFDFTNSARLIFKAYEATAAFLAELPDLTDTGRPI